jgi:hypothetical protein
MTASAAAGRSNSGALGHLLREILGGDSAVDVRVIGTGSLPSVFAVTDLATASIAAAGVATSELVASFDGHVRPVSVDRRLASLWFSSSLRPMGWEVPAPWDPIAGDYRTADGWIRLHTNAPAHRRVALDVLEVPADRAQVAESVAHWNADELEATIVATGGCAAAMHSSDGWNVSEPGRAVAAEPLIRWTDTGNSYGTNFTGASIERPLAGARVLDLTRVLAGPVATRFLAMLGAEVLRIDPPDWDEPGVVPDVLLGKRTARSDLRDSSNRERFLELLASADVLVHGYRPGALDHLGLGPEVRLAARPGLIEVALDAYGWTGPWSGRRGFDSLVQMSTGIADAGMRGLARDKPTPLPVQALDHGTGYLMAFAVLRALRERRVTGRGARAELSLARTAVLLTDRGTRDVMEQIRPEDDADSRPEIEHTSWGRARRLKSPLAIDGVELRADRPARALGSDSLRW